MNTQTVSSAVSEVQAVADAILSTIGLVDPAVSGATVFTKVTLALFAQLVDKALAAYLAAAGVPITPETIAALLPNPTPLTPPVA